MFDESIPPIEPGDEIKAEWLNRIRRAAVAMLGLKVEAPLELVRTAGGLMIRLVWRPRFWIVILSGAQPYAWREKVAAAAGAWTDASGSGTVSVDPAYEQNANIAVPAGIVVLARRAWGTGAVTFQLAPCTANTPAPGVTPGFSWSGPAALMPPPPARLQPPPANFSGFSNGSPLVAAVPIPP